MIFVTVGTNEARFDRLLDAVDRLRLDEDLVVQHGPSPVQPTNATCFDYLPFPSVVDYVRRARVVVTHAGVGSIMVALANGKRPVVVARLRAHGEAVDDHQVAFGRRFAAAGLVTLLESPDELGAALGSGDHVARRPTESTALAADLRGFLEERIARARRGATAA
jgi:UDP-N-acetylglucosamine transferase subunit ALG13